MNKKRLRFQETAAYLFDTLFFLVPRDRRSKSKKEVLIVRMDAIGDFILWLGGAKALRTLYPPETHRLTLLANATWVELAKTLPYFDDVWPIDITNFLKHRLYRCRQLFNIRRASFEIAIQPTFSRWFFLGDTVVRLSGAAERLASTGDFANINSRQKDISDCWYTRLIPAAPHPLMELERNAEFVRGLGLSYFRSAVPELTIADPTPRQKEAYFVIVPGAGNNYRQWNIQNFKEVAIKLHEATGWQAVVCGSSREKNIGDALAFNTTFIDTGYIGLTSLVDLAAIIKGAKLVVANETSAVHLAAAVSTPSVAILGGGHFGRFLPYGVEDMDDRPLPRIVTHKMDCFGCNWNCVYGEFIDQPMPCIEKISVDDAWKVIEEVIIE